MEDPDLTPSKHLVCRVFDALPAGTELSYIDAQKILYLTQRRLDADDWVAASLPFYWYVHGPMSTVVSHALFEARREGVLEARTTETGGQVYTPGTADPPGVERDTALERAESALSTVLDEYDVSGSLDERLREAVYVDAPYDFQSYYKFEVLPAVEAFTRQPYFLAVPPAELQFRLARAEAKVPTAAGFGDWRRRFSRFVTLAERYLDAVDESTKHGVEAFERLADDAWVAFAKRLRIAEHDPAYDDDVDGWRIAAEEALESFDDALDRFERTRVAVDHDSQFARVPEDDGWGVVAESLLTESDHD